MARARNRSLWVAVLALFTLAACDAGGGAGGKAADDGWTEQRVAGLAISTPGPLSPVSPRSAAYQAAAGDASIDSLELYQRTTFGFAIAVLRARYQPDVKVDLDDAVEEAMASAGARPGVSKLTVNTSPDTVSGRVGTHLSGTYDQPGGTGRMEMLVLVDGNTLWLVQIFFEERMKNAESTAERILESVRVEP